MPANQRVGKPEMTVSIEGPTSHGQPGGHTLYGSRGRVTIHEVARRAGVSITTVSHVINQTRRVEIATRARVEAAIAELGYRRNALANALAHAAM